MAKAKRERFCAQIAVIRAEEQREKKNPTIRRGEISTQLRGIISISKRRMRRELNGRFVAYALVELF
jgi:hypothetical protein